MNYQYIGKSTPVNNSRAKASGLLRYAGDMKLPNMLHMKLVLSPVAHGIVKAIDSSAALAMPGVAAVLSFENTVDTKYNRGRVRISEDVMDQETLFSRHVRFVGDRVAAVLADSPEIAAAAAEKIKLEIEELPAVFTVEDAMKEGAPQLHEGGNTVTLPESGFGGKYSDAQGEEFIHRSQTQRVSHIAMETHCAVADYNPGTDRMTVWSPTQSTFGVRSCVAALLGMPMSHVRAIKTPMGGSFGCKQEMILEPLAAAGAKMTCRPVKLQLDRREAILCTVLRHPIKSEIRAKFDENHVLKALDLTAQLDAGGYQGISPDYMGSMFKKLAWVYGVEDVEYHATSTCTNTPVSGSYRGWGGPETAFIMENMMNAAAQKFRCDPSYGSKISCRPTRSARSATSRSAMYALRTCCALAVNVSAGPSAAPPRRRRIEAAAISRASASPCPPIPQATILAVLTGAPSRPSLKRTARRASTATSTTMAAARLPR